MSILRLEGVHREVGTFVILDRIDAAIALGDRVGLVGPNGAGKTTLLRIAAGLDEPDAGRVSRKRELTIGMLAQEAHLDEAFMAAPDVRTAVRHGAAPLERMAVELEALEHANRSTEPEYEVLQHRFETLGGYTLDQRVDEALGGLGFSVADMARAPVSLSGGEQTRATLARLVIAAPDLLLLDEPTNHLDLGALEWLEDHLRRRSGSLLVASHDRAFLDATVNRIWELRDRQLTAFRGDYSAYHRQRQERDALAVKTADTQEESIARERELVQRYRSHRKFSKMHEHEARLERLQAERKEAPKTSRKLRLPGQGLVGAGPVRSGEIVVRIEGLAVGYLPDKLVGEGAVPCGPARRQDRDRRAERGREDDAPADDRRRPAGHGRLALVRQRRAARLPGPAPGGGDSRGDRDRCAARIGAGDARRGARPTSRASSSAATTRSRRSGSCRAASGRAWSSRCSASCRRTSTCSTSRRTTWTSLPARPSRRSSSRRRRRCSSSRTTGDSSTRCASGCGWSTAARSRRSTAAIAHGERRSRTGGPWPRRSSRRQRRLQPRRHRRVGRHGLPRPGRRASRLRWPPAAGSAGGAGSP